jgi:hypothetical protein
MKCIHGKRIKEWCSFRADAAPPLPQQMEFSPQTPPSTLLSMSKLEDPAHTVCIYKKADINCVCWENKTGVTAVIAWDENDPAKVRVSYEYIGE